MRFIWPTTLAVLILTASVVAVGVFCFKLSLDGFSKLGDTLSGIFAFLAFIAALAALADSAKTNQKQREELERQRRSADEADNDRRLDARLMVLHQAFLAQYPDKTHPVDIYLDLAVRDMPASDRDYLVRICTLLRTEASSGDGVVGSAIKRRVTSSPKFMKEIADQLREIWNFRGRVSPETKEFLESVKPDEVAELIDRQTDVEE